MALMLSLVLVAAADATAARLVGYYRHPAIHGDTVVFAAEGDLWQVARAGGGASRLTTHPAEEANPAISPDGATLAFSAAYEGPTEVYTMPLAGGAPQRRTYDGGGATVVGWTPNGELLYATRRYRRCPTRSSCASTSRRRARTPVPLAQAADGSVRGRRATLYFTRLPFQGSHTKRYRGGTAQSVWSTRTARRRPCRSRPTTPARAGRPWSGTAASTSLSDRDGTHEPLVDGRRAGGDLRQHTRHKRLGRPVAVAVAGAASSTSSARTCACYDIASGSDAALDVRLASDFDQVREHWIKKPIDYVTSLALAPTAIGWCSRPAARCSSRRPRPGGSSR